MTVPPVEIVTLPPPLLLANTPSPVFPSTTPLADIERVPVPTFSARIPLAEPVTAAAVIVNVVPLAVVFLAKIP